MCNFFKRMVASGESVAEKIGVERDAFLIVDEGEEVVTRGDITPEEAFISDMADSYIESYIEMKEKEEIIDSFGVVVDMKAKLEEFNARYSAMVEDLLSAESKDDLDLIVAFYGDMAKRPAVAAYVKSKFS